MICDHCQSGKCMSGGHQSAIRMLDALINNKKIVGLGVFNSVRRGKILGGYIDRTNCTFKFDGWPVGPYDPSVGLIERVWQLAYPNVCSHARNKIIADTKRC